MCEKERETTEGVRRKEGTESVCEKVETTECLWDVGKKGGQLNVCRKKEGTTECMWEKRGDNRMYVGKKRGQPNVCEKKGGDNRMCVRKKRRQLKGWEKRGR